LCGRVPARVLGEARQALKGDGDCVAVFEVELGSQVVGCDDFQVILRVGWGFGDYDGAFPLGYVGFVEYARAVALGGADSCGVWGF